MIELTNFIVRFARMRARHATRFSKRIRIIAVNGYARLPRSKRSLRSDMPVIVKDRGKGTAWEKPNAQEELGGAKADRLTGDPL